MELLSGQKFSLSGQHWNTQIVNALEYIATSSDIAMVSGQRVIVQSGVHVVSDIIVEMASGMYVRLESGSLIIADVHVEVSSGLNVTIHSGATVHVDSGLSVIAQSGISVILESGTSIHVDSGLGVVTQSGIPVIVQSGLQVRQDSGLYVQISGQGIIQNIPTAIITSNLVIVTANSGGMILGAGSVKGITVKSMVANSGYVVVGGSEYKPYFVSATDACGFVLSPGDAISPSINNINAVYVAAQVSGDLVTYMGVN